MEKPNFLARNMVSGSNVLAAAFTAAAFHVLTAQFQPAPPHYNQIILNRYCAVVQANRYCAVGDAKLNNRPAHAV